MSSVIAIMTRSPSDPRIKARLIPRIPSEEARSDLALAFLDDLMDRCRALPGVLLRLAVTPPVEGLRVHRPNLPADAFLPQRGGGLHERQRHVFEDLATSGFTHAVLIGSDLPDLPVDYLEQALVVLNESASTVVLGPSDDGGCYLIGLRLTAQGPVPDLFSGVRWESPHAQDDLNRACERIGLTVRWLPAWNDVDAPDDVDLLAGRLRYAPDAAPHTAGVMRRLGLI